MEGVIGVEEVGLGVAVDVTWGNAGQGRVASSSKAAALTNACQRILGMLAASSEAFQRRFVQHF